MKKQNKFKNFFPYTANILWFAAIMLYTAVFLIELSLLSTVITISYVRLHQLAVVGVTLLLIKEIFQFKLDKNYIIRSLILGIIFGILFLISFRAAGTDTLNKYFAQAFCYAFSARNVNWKTTGIAIGSELLFILACLFFLSVSGVLPNFVFIQSNGTRIRQSLGFPYCLKFLTCLFNAILLILSARQKQINFVSLAAMLIITGLLYRMTDARIHCLGISLVCFGAVINKLYPLLFKKLKIFFWILVFSPMLYLVSSTLMTIYYNPNIKWMKVVNQLLESRLSLSHNAFFKYKPQLFGQHVLWQGSGATFDGYTALNLSNYNWVDNFYIKEMIDHGLIYVLVLILFITIALIYCMREEQYFSILLVAVLYGVGLIDDQLRLYCYNGLLLYLGNVIMHYSKTNKKVL